MQTGIGRLLLPFAALVALFATPLCAQTYGEITGHIADSSGAVAPGTQITLTNVATNAVRTTATTDSGDYTFPSVAPGFYNIKFEHAGFKAGKIDNFQLIRSALLGEGE